MTGPVQKLVLLRHGESQWNRENRFTGWTDVDLSDSGVAEARAAGRLLKSLGYRFDLAFTSMLKRAIRTLWIALDELDQMWLPVEKNWRLNRSEEHTSELQSPDHLVCRLLLEKKKKKKKGIEKESRMSRQNEIVD